MKVPVVTACSVSGVLQDACTHDLIQSWLLLWVISDKLVYFPGLGFFLSEMKVIIPLYRISVITKQNRVSLEYKVYE